MIRDAIRKPEWHGCITFDRAWEAVKRVVLDPRASDFEVNACLELAARLGEARVIKANRPQIVAVNNALGVTPVIADDDRPRLPFDPLFIDLDGNISWLAEEVEGGLQIALFPQISRRGGDLPFAMAGLGAFFQHGEGTNVEMDLRTFVRGVRSDDHAAMAEQAMWTLRGLLYLLNSCNVDLVEEVLPRQARRQAARREQAIPLVITVGDHRARRPSRRTGTRRTFSHAHDRAGNFAHRFEQTRAGTPDGLFAKWAEERPDKMLTVNGQPCFRIWRPPTIVGAGDGPYVPKVRKVAA